MNFTTKVPILKYDTPIDYDSNINSIGSCFAENMSDKFTYFKFQNIVNPFGIIFNPVSIENSIKRIVSKQKFTNKDLFFHNDLWHCFEVHSRFSNPNDVLPSKPIIIIRRRACGTQGEESITRQCNS